MYKDVFEEIINDIVRRNHGDKNVVIILYHSNGAKITTSYQYLVFEENYLKILKSDEGGLCQYILYSAISAVYSNET